MTKKDPLEIEPMEPQPIKLNIGGGLLPVAGYKTVDVIEGSDIVAPGHDLPFGDGTVDAIYDSNMLCVYNTESAKALFKEWFRVLKAGGELEVVEPDFVAALHEWLSCTDQERLLRPMNLIFGNPKEPTHAKHMGFSKGIMKLYLQEAGFAIREIKVYADPTHQGNIANRALAVKP